MTSFIIGQKVLELLKKCLKFRNRARKLRVVFNYFLADVHKYYILSFIKDLTLDFLVGDQTRSEPPMSFFFPKSTVPALKTDNYAFS